jgi:hypothetical protein
VIKLFFDRQANELVPADWRLTSRVNESLHGSIDRRDERDGNLDAEHAAP